jgi:hypothetical protein
MEREARRARKDIPPTVQTAMVLTSALTPAFFATGGGHFQLVTICYQFTSLFSQAAFEDFPILFGRLITGLLRQYPDDVRTGPCLPAFLLSSFVNRNS